MMIKYLHFRWLWFRYQIAPVTWFVLDFLRSDAPVPVLIVSAMLAVVLRWIFG